MRRNKNLTYPKSKLKKESIRFDIKWIYPYHNADLNLWFCKIWQNLYREFVLVRLDIIDLWGHVKMDEVNNS